MANKTVQLTNENGTSVNPICGGVLSVVQNDELADGSVTHAKLDSGSVFRSSISWGSVRKTLLDSPNGVGYGDPEIQLADDFFDFDFIEVTYLGVNGAQWIEKLSPKLTGTYNDSYFFAPGHWHRSGSDSSNLYYRSVRFSYNTSARKRFSAGQSVEVWIPSGHTPKVYASSDNNKILKIVGVKI